MNNKERTENEKPEAIDGMDEPHEAEAGGKISRRKLLTSIGVTGAALVSGGMLPHAFGGPSVSQEVYENRDDADKETKKPNIDADRVA